MIIYIPVIVLLGCLPCLHSTEVLSSPKIIKQPSVGQIFFHVKPEYSFDHIPISLECEAEGTPPLEYSWRKNGEIVSVLYSTRKIMQPGIGTLVIKKPEDIDAGVYECVVTNYLGTTVSNSVTVLKSSLKPFKTYPPLIISGNEGEPFKLSCEAPDGWPKPKLSWLMQNISNEIKSINNSRITLDPEGNLWFSNLTREDASDNFVYVCAAALVTNFEDRVGNPVIVNVHANGILPSYNEHEPVLQYVNRKNEVALRGKSVELFCIYGGTPLPQTVWLKNGKRIQFSDRIAQRNYGKSIIIEVVDFDDEGTYTCEVSNGVGKDQVYSINLDVLAAPYFTEEPECIKATEGETVEFRCNASGIPEPHIEWILNGDPIKEVDPDPRRKVSANSIVIENTTRSDWANYGCKATNVLGHVYKDVLLFFDP